MPVLLFPGIGTRILLKCPRDTLFESLTSRYLGGSLLSWGAEFIEVSLTSEHVPMSNESSFNIEHATTRPGNLDIGRCSSRNSQL